MTGLNLVAERATLNSRQQIAELTEREREVFLLLARGFSNADIAAMCFISETTVKTHVRQVLSKLELHDRTQVVVFAYESGAVRPGGYEGWREVKARHSNVARMDGRLTETVMIATA